MIESPDFTDPVHGIPVFSLYGEVRRPTPEMMDNFDVLLVDLQDLGCRIYTFVTTLRYVLEAAAEHGKAVWVLDRPNPAGRPVEGLALRPGWESFVGAGPLPMRHGLTLGELAGWFIDEFQLDVECRVIPMDGWRPSEGPGYGWPIGDHAWINPSPNAPNLSMARCYAGTVMLEGTTLSEGRGTTRPLELFGAPDLDIAALVAEMRTLAPEWLGGCHLRPCWFEPTFHKHAGTLCAGLQIHVEDRRYPHDAFRPWRLQRWRSRPCAGCARTMPLWRDFPYEYEHAAWRSTHQRQRAAARVGGRPGGEPADLDALATADESAWEERRAAFLPCIPPETPPDPATALRAWRSARKAEFGTRSSSVVGVVRSEAPAARVRPANRGHAGPKPRAGGYHPSFALCPPEPTHVLKPFLDENLPRPSRACSRREPGRLQRSARGDGRGARRRADAPAVRGPGGRSGPNRNRRCGIGGAGTTHRRVLPGVSQGQPHRRDGHRRQPLQRPAGQLSRSGRTGETQGGGTGVPGSGA